MKKSLSLFITTWLIVSLPLVGWFISRQFEYTPSLQRFVERFLTIGWNKEKLLDLVILLGFLGSFALYFRMRREPGRGRRTVVLCLLAFCHGILALWVSTFSGYQAKTNGSELDHLWSSLPRVEAQNLRLSDALFHAFRDIPKEVKTFSTLEEFYLYSDRLFSRLSGEMAREWRIKDPSELRALFFMNLVSSLWAYGNRENQRDLGCVYQNEETGNKAIPSEMLSVHFYMNSKISCCSDNALFLRLLLDRAGFENRTLYTFGHVFNQAKLGDRWWTLDSTINMAISHPWREILEPGRLKKIPVYLFPNRNFEHFQDASYRQEAWALRNFILARVATGAYAPFEEAPGKIPKFLRSSH